MATRVITGEIPDNNRFKLAEPKELPAAPEEASTSAATVQISSIKPKLVTPTDFAKLSLRPATIQKKDWGSLAEESDEGLYDVQKKQKTVSLPNEATGQKNWLVIYNGPHRRVYSDWATVSTLVMGRKNISYESFKTKAEAEDAFRRSYMAVLKKEAPAETSKNGMVQRRIPRATDVLSRENQREPAVTLETFWSAWNRLTRFKESDATMGFFPSYQI